MVVFQQVKWKKQSGSLELDDEGISFRVDGSSISAHHISWTQISKHQVSPVSYPKSLLKLVLSDGSNSTFQMLDRPSLETIRKDITSFLQQHRNNQTNTNGNNSPPASSSGKKRPFAEVSQSTSQSTRSIKSVSYGDLDPTSLAVTRSTLLAAHPNLRQQHQYLVHESQTVTEEDFWKTHQDLLEEEYARMSGVAKAGSTSLLQSHVPASGKVTLGVEEMRQIFILYPAVHKAYEEKVPLSLSDEEFWRKYLESEYFHRDRGRMGTAARNHQPNAAANKSDNGVGNDKKKANSGPTVEEQDARAAAISADDLFSRYEQKLQESNAATAEGNGDAGRHRRWGTHLAVGQFDLAQTMETERGKLLEGPRDNHPPNQVDDGKGARVIEKYNRHWAMVLHPDEAVAGSNLMQVARKSVQDSLPNDDDAKPGGGFDKEMRQLSDFASSAADRANHATGVGVHEGENYEQLSLRNVEAYYSGSQLSRTMGNQGHVETEAALAKRHSDFSKVMAAKAQAIANASVRQGSLGVLPLEKCFPPPKLGRDLLTALTKKMAQDSRTEAASLEKVNKLPEDFRNRLQSYFRRSSELLRHFFGLRRLGEEHRGSGNSGFGQKLAKINTAMANFYREMEQMRRDLPQTETGEIMRKMCLPIMEQLDWAFKLHREGSGGGGGGFVDVEDN